MSGPKIQSLAALREEMKAVARGERPAPPDAARPSFQSVEALARLLTPENRHLMALIRDHEPQSVGELARLSGRAPSNMTRTLAKLEAAGLVIMTTRGRQKAPRAAVHRILVEIDPFSDEDRLDVA